MSFISEFKERLFSINEDNFNDSSLEVFKYQFNQNVIYQQYCKSLKRTPRTVRKVEDIPFLPISFFKTHPIRSSSAAVQKVFKSSGTTSQNRSKHYIADLEFYHRIARKTFEGVFGPLASQKVIALLPSYLEQGDSSLISMIDSFLPLAAQGSGYALGKNIESELEGAVHKILFGVSFALLDLTLSHRYQNVTLIETGGMKGRRKEITRQELHQEITKNTGVTEVWSEYGMTELQSQAYGKNGAFRFEKWAKVLVREVNDPFCYVESKKTGGLNVIDLANVETCSFIETKDLGKMDENGSFQVLGRFDNSDIRGCNLLV